MRRRFESVPGSNQERVEVQREGTLNHYKLIQDWATGRHSTSSLTSWDKHEISNCTLGHGSQPWEACKWFCTGRGGGRRDTATYRTEAVQGMKDAGRWATVGDYDRRESTVAVRRARSRRRWFESLSRYKPFLCFILSINVVNRLRR